MNGERVRLGSLLLDAIRDLPRFVHGGIDRGLRRAVWRSHGPFKVAEHELICRRCKPFESWPCAALREYEAERDAFAGRPGKGWRGKERKGG